MFNLIDCVLDVCRLTRTIMDSHDGIWSMQMRRLDSQKQGCQGAAKVSCLRRLELPRCLSGHTGSGRSSPPGICENGCHKRGSELKVSFSNIFPNFCWLCLVFDAQFRLHFFAMGQWFVVTVMKPAWSHWLNGCVFSLFPDNYKLNSIQFIQFKDVSFRVCVCARLRLRSGLQDGSGCISCGEPQESSRNLRGRQRNTWNTPNTLTFNSFNSFRTRFVWLWPWHDYSRHCFAVRTGRLMKATQQPVKPLQTCWMKKWTSRASQSQFARTNVWWIVDVECLKMLEACLRRAADRLCFTMSQSWPKQQIMAHVNKVKTVSETIDDFYKAWVWIVWFLL
jgi:hypothetical protein